MSPINESIPFEQRANVLLEESVLRIDGHVRSRLNQSRQAAVAEATRRGGRPAFWRHFTLMPATGAVAAALLVAVVLWHRQGAGELPLTEVAAGTHTAAAEDLDLLADGEALDLVEEGDGSGSFYEWAMDQTSDSNPAAPQQGETDT